MDTKMLTARIPQLDSPLAREALLFGIALAFGVLVLPYLIYAVGQLTLGDYANGGGTALLGDFIDGLASGSPTFWSAALGPYLFLQLARFGYRLVRPRG